jgi:hypothetical protein
MNLRHFSAYALCITWGAIFGAIDPPFWIVALGSIPVSVSAYALMRCPHCEQR